MPLRRPPLRPDERGNLQVMESLLVVLVLVGAILFSLTFDGASAPAAPTQQDLALQAGDVLQVLASLRATDGTYGGSTLDQLVAGAILRGSPNLGVLVDRMLPAGASGKLLLVQGNGSLSLTAGPGPTGPAVTASLLHAPAYHWVYLEPDLRVYPSTSRGNLTLLGVPACGGVPVPRSAPLASSVTFPDGYGVPLAPVGGSWGVWTSGAVPNAVGQPGFPVGGSLLATSNLTHHGHHLVGSTAYAVSNATVVAHANAPLRTGLGASLLRTTPTNATVGTSATLRYDLRPVMDQLAAAGVATLGTPTVHLEVLGPLPDETLEPTGWKAVASWDRSDLAGNVTWTVPGNALLGAHPVVAELNLTLDDGGAGIPQSARLLGLVTVNPAGSAGAVPPLYDLQLVAWYDG